MTRSSHKAVRVVALASVLALVLAAAAWAGVKVSGKFKANDPLVLEVKNVEKFQACAKVGGSRVCAQGTNQEFVQVVAEADLLIEPQVKLMTAAECEAEGLVEAGAGTGAAEASASAVFGAKVMADLQGSARLKGTLKGRAGINATLNGAAQAQGTDWAQLMVDAAAKADADAHVEIALCVRAAADASIA